MDLISAFKSELFRPLATIVAPGVVASAPWLACIFYLNPEIRELVSKYDGTAGFAGILLFVIFGFLLENIGARVERLWDSQITAKSKDHNEKWKQYLRLNTKDDIIAQRYLRTIVLRMKFELAFAPALLIGVVGMYRFNMASQYWSWCGFNFGALLALSLAGYFLWESHSSAEIAAAARDRVIESMASAPPAPPKRAGQHDELNGG